MQDVLQPVALKEWAVAVSALASGKQILVMRKGGIVEETKHFELQSHAFYLYPTYEHQQRALLKEPFRADLDATLIDWSPNDTTVPLQLYAEVAADLEITDQAMLNKLRDFHIWTDQFAEERLKWKKKLPLHVLLLRVYRRSEVITLPIEEQYLGCKSWIRMPEQIVEKAGELYIPVLSDQQFDTQVNAIRQALES